MIDKNDPRLTAYVLGDLENSEITEIDAALESSAELRTLVAEIRQTTEALAGVYQSEPELLLTEQQKSEVLAAASTNSDVHYSEIQPKQIGYSEDSNSLRRWLPIAVAAGLMCVMVGSGIYFSQESNETSTQLASDTTEAVQPPVAADKLDDEDNAGSVDSNLLDDTDAPHAFKVGEGELDLSSDPAMAGQKGDPSNEANSQASPAVARAMNKETGGPGNLLADSDAGGDLRQSSSAAKAMPQADSPTERNQSAGGEEAEFKLEPVKPPAAIAANSVEKDAGVAMVEPFRATGDTALDQLPKTANAEPKPLVRMSENALISKAKEIELAQTQKMIDQSNLGILGLQVVAAKPLADLRSVGGLAGGGLGGGSQRAASIPVNKHALQISKAVAEQAVEQLAQNIDPDNKRELTFDDLIGIVTTDRSNSSMAKRQPSAMSRRLSKAEREAKLRDQATRQLAFNLRSFIGQKSPDAQAGMGVGGGSVNSVPATFDGDGTSNRSASSKADPGTKRAAERSMNQNPSQLNAWTNLQLLDLDYSQVIDQLKLSLKRRNEKLKAD